MFYEFSIKQPASHFDEAFTMIDLEALSERAQASESASNNARRIYLAASSLLHFAMQTKIRNSTEPAETAITDFLTDLMHLCGHIWSDDSPLSFESVLDTARMHFTFESQEEALWSD